MRKSILNNWTMHTDQAGCCELPKDVADAFSEAIEGFVSMQFKPVLYVASKEQNGMYYSIICKTTELSDSQRQDLKTVYIFKSVSGASTVVRIEDVLCDR